MMVIALKRIRFATCRSVSKLWGPAPFTDAILVSCNSLGMHTCPVACRLTGRESEATQAASSFMFGGIGRLGKEFRSIGFCFCR